MTFSMALYILNWYMPFIYFSLGFSKKRRKKHFIHIFFTYLTKWNIIIGRTFSLMDYSRRQVSSSFVCVCVCVFALSSFNINENCGSEFQTFQCVHKVFSSRYAYTCGWFHLHHLFQSKVYFSWCQVISLMLECVRCSSNCIFR